jgi:hypothetical protein
MFAAAIRLLFWITLTSVCLGAWAILLHLIGSAL